MDERFRAIKERGEAEARAIAAQIRVLESSPREVEGTLGWMTLGLTPLNAAPANARDGENEPAGERSQGAAGEGCTCAYCAHARALTWARSPAGTPYGAVE